MELGDLFGDDGEVTYAVEDLTVASIRGGKVYGVNSGETILYATHKATGATVESKITVTMGCTRDDSCPMTPFTDLDKNAWYHDGVHWALENGVMNGVGDNKFDPSGTTIRAMIVTMLYRMEGEPEVTSEMSFDDVPADTWYTDAVAWAEEKSIVNGYGKGKFGPEDPVTREQIVTILYRYAQYKGLNVSAGETEPLKGYIDVRHISAWALPAFRWSVDAGIIKGTAKDMLSPKKDASRVEVATMLMRYSFLKE